MAGARPFPFVVGCQRSGTTLLRAMLDTHPEMAVPPESNFLPTLMESRSKYEGDAGFDVEGLVEDMFATRWIGRWELPRELLVDALTACRVDSLADALRCVYGLYAERRGKTRYADKTPDYVAELPAIAELFPEARFIHVIRDGRDVALSLLELEWGPSSVAQAAIYWRDRVSTGRRDGSSLGDRYLEVRYEHLVAQPNEVIGEVCDFVDLERDPRMLGYSDRAHEIEVAPRTPGVHRNLALPPTPGLREWSKEMSERDIFVFDRLAGGTLVEFGYERAQPRVALPGTARSIAVAGSAEIRALARRTRKRFRAALHRISG